MTETFGPLSDLMVAMATAICGTIIGIFKLVPF